MEWEIGTLGRGKYRLSLFRLAEGETLCDVLEGDTAHACVILAGDLDLGRPGGQTQVIGPGHVATMASPGTYCLHANQDTLGLRGSIHTEKICSTDSPRQRPPRRPGWGEVFTGVAAGGTMFGSMLGLWMTLRSPRGRS